MGVRGVQDETFRQRSFRYEEMVSVSGPDSHGVGPA